MCEDEKSSRDYLASFPVDSARVEIACVGTGMNTDSLMMEAIKRKHAEGFDEAWVVFDKDDFPDQQFNRAIDLAKGHNDIVACWSNQCFELWYLLHFQFQNTGISRQDIVKKLEKLLGEKYDKADDSMYDKILDRVEEAIANGDRLASKNATAGTIRENPSTLVQELVKLLKSLDPGED